MSSHVTTCAVLFFSLLSCLHKSLRYDTVLTWAHVIYQPYKEDDCK